MGHVIVVGGGQAGASCVAKLRQLGSTDEITVIGAEAVPPYQRPPLSKSYLLGEMERERLFLRPEQYYADQGITLLLGEAASHIDRSAQTVTVGDRQLTYTTLVLATGSSARRLPDSVGGGLSNVHVVRDLGDVDAMAPACLPGKRALIVGGGYIGLEAAAVAAKVGMKVTLVEMADRILQRVAAPETSDYFRAIHRANGVSIREGIGLSGLVGNRAVTGANLTDGSHVECDLVIVGIGISPNVDLARQAGLTVDNGIATDVYGTTSDPNIYAAGDCASFPWQKGRMRLESVQNAIDQAETVAANIIGPRLPYVPKPWFWSDQYDIKLQIAGLNTGYDRVVVREGDGRSHWYYAGPTLLAVDAMNDPRAYMVGKRLIEANRSPDPAEIADGKSDLRAMLKA
ncbi:NAD(P)/FAD-dependent oxidoreductase [Actibacterium sp. 188UL27-1]|uniref:NAD(P)/FAD-dependent oxidoreductase n=1 Tax=Actibacterium sp. 188UL27-1 TaxID=2786961 RepID=UPI00195D0EE0|nr:FAD/NAD(P)-binding oxidoreductase [Actibacterium sp. 188UL27-1]MBM7066009.1 NAD(P)/FAD-dependent oxidoreductase [Actibacterium sp. 188UL27-1]